MTTETQDLQHALLHNLTAQLETLEPAKLQSLTYLLQQALGVPLKLPFFMHHYGPYSDQLDTEITRLKFLGYLKVEPGYQVIVADKAHPEWHRILTPYQAAVDQVARAYGQESLTGIELTASIHFAEYRHPDEPLPKILARVRAMKHKLSPERIQRSHTELQQFIENFRNRPGTPG